MHQPRRAIYYLEPREQLTLFSSSASSHRGHRKGFSLKVTNVNRRVVWRPLTRKIADDKLLNVRLEAARQEFVFASSKNVDQI